MRLLLFLLLTTASAVATVPPQVFASLYAAPDIVGISLSPDGKSLCYLSRPTTGTGTTVNVLEVDAAAIKAQVTITQADLVGVGGLVHWINSSRFLVELGSGDMVAMDTNGKNLTRIVDVKNPLWAKVQAVRVKALPPKEPDFVYIAGGGGQKTGSEAGWKQMIFRVHLGTGAVEKLAEEEWDGPIIVDRQGQARIKVTTPNLAPQFSYRTPDGAWRPLDQLAGTAETAPFDVDAAHYFGQRSQPVGFGDDPNLLYIVSNSGRDTLGVYALDLRTGRRTDLALEHPSYDLIFSPSLPNERMLDFDRSSHQLAGVRYHRAKLEHLWRDPEIAGVQARLDALVGQDAAVIEEWDDARERFLVRRMNHTRRDSHALYFRKEDKLRTYLADQSAGKAPQSAYTTPWAFKREGGETLSGYLTLPRAPRAKPIPIVVCIGSSELSRATSAYSADVAALAQMGYAVLEVNHRGVPGLGNKHWLAARGRADEAAAEDILQAVDRLAGQAGLDRSKVAIFCNAYRSYLALRTAQIASDRIACVALTNPLSSIEGWSPSMATGFYTDTQHWFAGPDVKQWRDHSTLDQAGKLRKPLLLIVSHEPLKYVETPVDILRHKMIAAGNEPVLEVVADKPASSQYNVRLFSIVEAFFDKHLGQASH